jgi:hypothetical protein
MEGGAGRRLLFFQAKGWLIQSDLQMSPVP